MAGAKRPRENGETDKIEETQPDRKRRVKYTDADAQLAKIYNDLSDEVEATRSQAAQALIRMLWTKSNGRAQMLDAAIRRLVTGLCSGRKAARLGFSIALPEVLRLRFSLASEDGTPAMDLTCLVNNVIVWTRVESNARGPEKRDHMHGRRFAYQAILHSDIGLKPDLPNQQWQNLIECIFDLAKQKQWIRRDCGTMLYHYLRSPSGSKLSITRAQTIIEVMIESKQAKTPEGVGLWITLADGFPDLSFPKDVWHHRDPLSSKERLILGKIMLENAQDDESETKSGGYRQSTSSFAWSVVLSKLSERKGGKDLAKFWDEVVAGNMFSSSASSERKSLGLQIFSQAVMSTPVEKLSSVFHSTILRCLIDQRANKDRYLFEATKAPLNKIVERARQEPEAAPILVEALLTAGMSQLEQVNKLRLIDSILAIANATALQSIVEVIESKILRPGTSEAAQAEVRRRILADILLTIVRLHKETETGSAKQETKSKPASSWSDSLLKTLAGLAYLALPAEPPISKASRDIYAARLMSCLNALLEIGLDNGVWASVTAVKYVVREKASKNEDTSQTLKSASKALERAIKAKDNAFVLLISLSMLQVYNEEPDATGVLEDAVSCYDSKDQATDTSLTLIELLLSFASKPSTLFRKLAEQVFTAIASEMTADSLQSLLSILEQRESLSGQQELFDQNASDEEDGPEAEDIGAIENGDYEDVEDASDLELDNGNIVSASESDDEQAEDDDEDDEDDEESGDDSSNTSENDEDMNEDEEAAFDRKLAEALGTSGMEADSNDDGSDMDDEQMMALEPHLNTIFKERQKKTNKTKEKKDAKQNIVNFKNRVLDLLAIYMKAQPANLLSLDLLLPLATLINSTTSKPTAEKAFGVMKTYFDACTKHKALPALSSDEHVADATALLHALHAEMLSSSGAKLHANACNRAALFVAKVLCARDSTRLEAVVDAYAALLKKWLADPKSSVPQSVFTEWMSWSIETRRKME